MLNLLREFYNFLQKKSIVLLLILFFFGLSAWADQVSDSPAKPSELPKKYFELINDIKFPLSGQSIFYNQIFEKRALEQFENRFIIVHFWATWCMECLGELMALNELQMNFRKKALTVIAISEDFKSPEAIDQFFTKNKIDYLDIYIDKKNKIYQSLNINHLPATYLMDFNGNIIASSKPNIIVNWSDPDLIRFLEDKVSHIQLLPPEYKQLRDVYEKPKQEDIVNPKKETKRSKIFIN